MTCAKRKGASDRDRMLTQAKPRDSDDVERFWTLRREYCDNGLVSIRQSYVEIIMRITVVISLLSMWPAFANAQASIIKDLPDEARATIIKELARTRLHGQQLEGSGDAQATTSSVGNPGSSGGGCNLEVASQDKPGLRPPRTTTVVANTIVQICK